MSRSSLPFRSNFPGALFKIPTIFGIVFIIVLSSSHLASVTGTSGDIIAYDPTRSDDSLIISAWTIPWEPSCRDGMDKWSNTLDSLSPYWYQTLRDGSIRTICNRTYFDDYLDFCGGNGIELIPLVSNIHDPETVRLIVRDESVQRDHIGDLVDLTLTHGFHGLEINYESLYTEDRDAYVNFIGNLTDELHIHNKVLHVSVFPKTSEADDWYGPAGYDYPGLGERADYIRLMAYNLHWSTCEESGPVTSYDWVDSVVSYASSVIPPKKLILGIPQYGYEWPIRNDGSTTGIADNHTFRSSYELMRKLGIDRSWNITSRTPYFIYEDEVGKLRSHHYTDSESLLHEMDIVMRYSIRGISLWRIGEDDPLSEKYLNQIKRDGLDNLPPFVRIGGDLKGMIGTGIPIGPAVIYDIDGLARDVLWNFGDGSTSAEIDPSHVFKRGGIYNVSVTVTDDDGSVVVMNKMARIAPFSSLEGELHTKEGEPVLFDGSGSWDLHEIVSYSWNFGDGTALFHHTETAEHTYKYPGVYNVSLTVINSMGYSDTGCMTVIIEDDERPSADCGDDQVVWEDSVVFLDASKSSDNDRYINYTWDIDGMMGYGIFLKWIFPEPGTYPVYLTAADPSGNQDTDMINITVRDKTAPTLVLEYAPEISLGEDIVLDVSGSIDNVGVDRIVWHLSNSEPITDENILILNDCPAGRYYFTVEISDAEGNGNSTTVFVDVVDRIPPSCSIIHDPEPVPLNSTYIFDIEGIDDLVLPDDLAGTYVLNETILFSAVEIEDQSGIASIEWHFGDAHSATGESVYHEFGSVGLFRITLKIADIWGNVMIKEHSVLIIASREIMIEEHQPYVDINVIENITENHEDPQPVSDDDDDGRGRWSWLPYAAAAGFVILIGAALVDLIALSRKRKAGGSASRDEEVASDEK
ncbi:MAG: PKD domain-containing protein [Thermoplasmatota archaeon]